MGFFSELSLKEKEQGELSSLIGKYGLAMGLLFVNSRILIYLFYVLMVWLLGGKPAFDPLLPLPDDYYFITLMINELAAYLFPLIFTAVIFKNEALSAPKQDYRRFKGDFILIFISGVALSSIGTMITEFITKALNSMFGTPLPSAAFSNSMPHNLFQFLTLCLCTVIIAPLCEEVIFRGFLLKPLRKYGDLTAILISAAIFALFHGNVDQLAYALISGIFLGIITVRSNSILPSIILHSANNLIVSVISYMPEGIFGQEHTEAVTTLQQVMGIIMTAVIPLGIIAAVILAVKKVFRFENPSGIPKKEKLKLFFRNIPFIIGLVTMALIFIK